MRLVRQIAALLFIIAIPAALILTNIRVVANEPRVYEYATDHFDTPATTGIPRDELLRASAELRDYFNHGQDNLYVQVRTNSGQQISLFNSRETAHLRDVKDLFQASFRVEEFSVLFILAYVVTVFIWAREGSVRMLARELVAAAALTAAVIVVLGMFALTGFNAAFDRFHVIFFRNDLWQLDPARDHLVQMFPEEFWRDVSLWIGGATLAEAALLAGAAGAYLAVVRRRNAPRAAAVARSAQEA